MQFPHHADKCDMSLTCQVNGKYIAPNSDQSAQNLCFEN